jgi:hypothetical protein
VKIGVVRESKVSIFSFVRHQEVSQEAPFDIPENDPGESWPEHGEIVFDNYQARIAGSLINHGLKYQSPKICKRLGSPGIDSEE